MPITRVNPGSRMSQAVVCGNLVYTAGHVAEAPTLAEQTRRILSKIDEVLAQAGTSKANLISANIWLADITGFDEMNTEWDAWVDKDNLPVRATVQSALAGEQYKVEIAVIAALPSTE